MIAISTIGYIIIQAIIYCSLIFSMIARTVPMCNSTIRYRNSCSKALRTRSRFVSFTISFNTAINGAAFILEACCTSS
jgi:hypothetical protein